MARSDKSEFPDGCYLCDRTAGILHHISYVPEKVVLVCSDCHGLVHSKGYDGEPRHPELQPEMSRGEWLENHHPRDSAISLSSEQLNWDDDAVGSVDRFQ